MNEIEYYRQQSDFSHPGEFAELWDRVSPTIADMQAAITPLLFHYRGDGDWAENGISPNQIEEVDLRYADAMLGCIQAKQLIDPGQPRDANKRMVGCCRDWALLFVSLARHHGFAARSRVGFAGYFMDGWWIDHTIAEIWDESAQRWRLVDPELKNEWTLSSGQLVDPLDISPEIFLTGFDAWRKARSGELDAEKFVVHPEIDEANLRGFPYLWHNVVQDLAALNLHEMVLWDVWGIDLQPFNEDGAMLLDAVAGSGSLAEWQQFYSREEFRVPGSFLSFQPRGNNEPVTVELRKSLAESSR